MAIAIVEYFHIFFSEEHVSCSFITLFFVVYLFYCFFGDELYDAINQTPNLRFYLIFDWHRSKMTDIFNQATQLDTAMASSRASVDKLVRVRRLLDRLEFLSELPEKLSRMIDSCMYKDAVQLYRKSITVLTKHSHVLSFKKIKERTESMMNDLRKKVIALLDDPSLEAIKVSFIYTL